MMAWYLFTIVQRERERITLYSYVFFSLRVTYSAERDIDMVVKGVLVLLPCQYGYRQITSAVYFWPELHVSRRINRRHSESVHDAPLWPCRSHSLCGCSNLLTRVLKWKAEVEWSTCAAQGGGIAWDALQQKVMQRFGELHIFPWCLCFNHV